MQLPRKNGAWTFYSILTRWETPEANRWSVWTSHEKYDTRELAELLGYDYEEVTGKPVGKLYQESGITGYPNLDYAKILLRIINKEDPTRERKIVRRTLSFKEMDMEYVLL